MNLSQSDEKNSFLKSKEFEFNTIVRKMNKTNTKQIIKDKIFEPIKVGNKIDDK